MAFVSGILRITVVARLARLGLVSVAMSLAAGSGVARSWDAESPRIRPPVPAPSLLALARAHEHGEGIPKDYTKAAELYCKAARMGNSEAQFSLGWMYANGRGMQRDDASAAVLFGMAAKQGHEYARKMLRYVGESNDRVPRCLREERSVAAIESDTEVKWPEAASAKARKVVELVHKFAPEYAVDPRLALAVIMAESNFREDARSPKNAQGLMQLIPETAERFSVRNAFDPAQNIRGGLAYLRWLLAYFRGDVALVAAGYNAGEGAVDKYGGVPPYQETQAYVRKILSLFRKEVHPYDERMAEPSPTVRLPRGLPRKAKG